MGAMVQNKVAPFHGLQGTYSEWLTAELSSCDIQAYHSSWNLKLVLKCLEMSSLIVKILHNEKQYLHNFTEALHVRYYYF